jgi:hypothetical protein
VTDLLKRFLFHRLRGPSSDYLQAVLADDFPLDWGSLSFGTTVEVASEVWIGEKARRVLGKIAVESYAEVVFLETVEAISVHVSATNFD